MPVASTSREDYLDDIFADLDEATLQELDDLARAHSTNHVQHKRPSPRKRPLSVTAPLQSARPTKLHKPSSNSTTALGLQPSNGLTMPSKAITLGHALPVITVHSGSCRPSVLTPTRPSSSKKRGVQTPAVARTSAAIPAAVPLEDLSWLDEEYLPSPAKSAQPARMTQSAIVAERPLHETILTQTEVQDNPATIVGEPISGQVPMCKRFTRCSVISVTEKILQNFRRVKTVVVLAEPGNDRRRVVLCDEWATTELKCGDVVNIVGTFTLNDAHSISDTGNVDGKCLPTCTLGYASDNLLILHPDTLISATRISDTVQCRRKAVVQELLRTSALALTPALVYGNLLHELFQACLLAMSERRVSTSNSTKDCRHLVENAFGYAQRSIEIERLLRVPRNVEQLFLIDIELDAGRQHLKEASAGFMEFAKLFVATHPQPEAFLCEPRTKNLDTSSATRLAIPQVYDIEEDIWSPRLGLKGKVDASVHAILMKSSGTCASAAETTHNIMPFEIKTGRTAGIMSHRAQTMLYTQMMSDRYDRNISAGLLYYSQTNEVVHVTASRNEMRGLIVNRNEVARFLAMDSPDDPGMSSQSTALSPKYHRTDALSSRKAIVNARDDDLYDDTSLEDLKTFDLSIGIGSKQKDAILPAPIDDARSCKKCYAVEGCMLYRRAVEKVRSLDIEDMQDIFDDQVGHLSDTHAAFFSKWERLISMEEREMQQTKKEILTMSATQREEQGRCWANMTLDMSADIQTAFSDSAKIHRYTYLLRRHNRQDSTAANLLNTQICIGDPIVVSAEPSMLALARGFVLNMSTDRVRVGVDHSLTILPGKAGTPAKLVFRIDKDELQTGLSKLRSNIAQLFFANGDEKRRRLIVDLEAPTFSDEIPSLTQEQQASLNADQSHALQKVKSAQDYALILGMPGTGKTTTIVEIVKDLVAAGKSILLTSYTHSAVDNILLKLCDCGIDMLRLGNVDKIMPALHHLTLDSKSPPASVAQLEHRYYSPKVVATTALSVDHPLFARRKFDYCIVDEASQITLPTCLGPLRLADKFVLVGDHHQLPPLVRSPQARKAGLDVSLFKILSDAHSSAIAYLTLQYRMNADIMSLSNRLIYGERLQCGSEDVARSSLVMSNGLTGTPACDSCMPKQRCWVKQIVDAQSGVVFVNTDGIAARETRSGRLVQNEAEAILVDSLTRAYLSKGVQEYQIGVISLYRQQIKLLQKRLRNRPQIEILTADKSQGRDKDLVMVSMVRSNAGANTGELLRDWRRINVCFTRARTKLIIFGSRETLGSLPVLRDFFDLIDARHWMYTLATGDVGRCQQIAEQASERTVAAKFIQADA